MPRVNRDLERRLAARRQRQSRRVAAGDTARYRMAATSAAAPEGHWPEAAPALTPARSVSRPARQAARPFSDYGKEYAYVVSDLRRIAVVAGGLMAFVVGLTAILRV